MLTIVTVYPELLGTYGDGGNALVLEQRARRRGINAVAKVATIDAPLPLADLYLLGGGEDGPQRLAADLLRASSLLDRVRDGAHVFAVCAGLQLLGRSFAVEGDDAYEGLGLLDVHSVRGPQRSVGDLAVMVDGRPLVGFENHGGVTILGAGVRPLGRVVRGRGNDGTVDGYVAPGVVATYAHGPVLALNPWFADWLLERVLPAPLAPLTGIADELYDARCRALGL